MTLNEIRFLLGGYGERSYSDELARTDRGIAWYDGKYLVEDQFFSWKDQSFAEGVETIRSFGFEFTEDELESGYFNS